MSTGGARCTSKWGLAGEFRCDVNMILGMILALIYFIKNNF